jgi:hypothetical protein
VVSDAYEFGTCTFEIDSLSEFPVHSAMEESPSAVSHGSIVQIVTWFLMVVSAFAFFARISTKWAMTKALNGDDAASIASLVR